MSPSYRTDWNMEDNGNIVIYEAEGGDVRLDVRLENDTVWLTQESDLFLYNLDVIISVGYRVKSIMGTRCDRWGNSFPVIWILRSARPSAMN